MKKFLFFLIVSPLFGTHFNPKWSIPDGINWFTSVIQGADTDHDEKSELLFRSESLGVPVIYELNDSGIFSLVYIIDTVSYPIFWGGGYYDNDSLSDVAIEVWTGPGQQGNLKVYESSDYYSYPDTRVWEGYLYGSQYGAGELFFDDFDNDGKMNFMKDAVRYIWIYENISNNSYQLVFEDSIPQSQNLEGAGIGDFDGDGRTEIAFGDLYGRVFVIENTGDNQFELVWDTTIYASMCYDNFSVDDADQDGKPEFVIHSYYYHPHITNKVWIFEATGDNSYEVVYLDTMVTPWTDDQGPISDAGDVDGDGIPELVVSGTTAAYILKATGDNTYERIWYYEPHAPGGGWLIQLDVEIYDLDNNGLNDIILSWTWVDNEGWLHARTQIFEKGIDMEWLYPSLPDTFLVDSVETLRWVVYDTISVESLYIYLTPLSNGGRDLIFVGDPLRDSTFLWQVPDSSGSYRLWLLVTGPGRKDSLASPTLFITATGVREKSSSIRPPEGLYPFHSNPLRPPLTLRYYLSSPIPEAQVCIVDVAGRVLRAFPRPSPGLHKLSWEVGMIRVKL